jgi:hypothetical protein
VSSLEPGDRRRLLVAGVSTIAALPFLLGGHGGGAGVATIGQRANLASALDSSTVQVASGVDPPPQDDGTSIGFMTGPPPATDPSLVQIAVPTAGHGNVREGTATFQRFANEGGTVGECAFAGPAVGAVLTVVDLDNGRFVYCTVVGPPAPSARADIVLSSSAFSQMADLGQAPVHVRVTW